MYELMQVLSATDKNSFNLDCMVTVSYLWDSFAEETYSSYKNIQVMLKSKSHVKTYRSCTNIQVMYKPISHVKTYRSCTNIQVMYTPISHVKTYRSCKNLKVM